MKIDIDKNDIEWLITTILMIWLDSRKRKTETKSKSSQKRSRGKQKRK